MRRVSIATVLIALAAAVGTVGVGVAQEKTLTIGVLGPLSGGAASYGVELVRGAEMRAEEINKAGGLDRKSTRLNSSHSQISYAVFCLKKKKKKTSKETSSK